MQSKVSLVFFDFIRLFFYIFFILIMTSLEVRAEIASKRVRWPRPLKSVSGDFCKDELLDIFKKHYGPDVKIISTKSFSSFFGWNLWVRVNFCKGWIVASFMNDSWECKKPHYFSRPRMLTGFYGFDEQCQNLIPDDIYWSSPVKQVY